MNEIITYPISSDFKIWAAPEEEEPFPIEIKKEVDEIWQHCQKISDWDLFDGKVFRLLHFEEDEIHGNFMRYRYFYAQKKIPELKKKLKITLVAVTGILSCQDEILMAKRSQKVTQYPGLWEFAPSGGLSIDYLSGRSVNYEKQIIDELTQEVGMDDVFIESVAPSLLVWDKTDLVVDIVCDIEVDRLGVKSAAYNSWEYTDYRWVAKNEIPDFITKHSCLPNVPIISKKILPLIE